MEQIKFKVLGLFTGNIQELSNKQMSAIHKTPVPEINVLKDRIEGDEIFLQKHHGGEMRVLHHYSQKNYDHLKERFPDIADRFIPGSLGENLLTQELDETQLCVGDLFKLGEVELELTVIRRPCATINTHYGDSRVLKEILESGKPGWFYRIIKEGKIRESDDLVFLERPNPELKLNRLFDQGYQKGPKFSDIEFLRACYKTGLMDKGWKPKIEKALGLD
jgi:MOSC domain-containing protein YiiM